MSNSPAGHSTILFLVMNFDLAFAVSGERTKDCAVTITDSKNTRRRDCAVIVLVVEDELEEC